MKWQTYPERLSLSHVDVARLLHSMALAPTDFTREAMLGASLALDARVAKVRGIAHL